MNTLIVYQTTSEGVYVQEAVADESPLEPGEFLIPDGCVLKKPPTILADELAVWNGKAWKVQKVPAPTSADSLPVEEQLPLTEKEKQALFVAAVQRFMDNTANTLGYDSLQSAVTYAEEPAVPKFQLEGKSLRAWRSLVWDYTYAQFALVQAGERAEPDAIEFLHELPPLVMLEPSADIPAEQPVEEPPKEVV